MVATTYTAGHQPLTVSSYSGHQLAVSQQPLTVSSYSSQQPLNAMKNVTSATSGPYVCLADVISVNLLTETEAWAILSQLTQRLQDNLYRSSSRYSDKENQSLFISGETVLLHSTGAISLAPNTVSALRANKTGGNIYATRSRISGAGSDEKDAEKRGLAEIGSLLQQSIQPIISLEFRTLLNQMCRCTADLGQVLISIQQFISGLKGKTAREVISSIYQNTVTAYTHSSINEEAACLPGSSKWKQSLPKQQQHLLLPNKQFTAAPASSFGSRSRQPLGAEQPVAARTRRRDTVTLGASLHGLYKSTSGVNSIFNSTSTVHNSTSTLPLSSVHTSTSTLPTASTTVLHNAGGSTTVLHRTGRSTSNLQLDSDSDRCRRYGKRLEFRPPMTEKLSRKFGANLDPNKSLSTSAIDKALQDLDNTIMGASIYPTVNLPYHNAKYATNYSTTTLPLRQSSSVTNGSSNWQNRRPQQILQPEFVTKSANPPIESCLAKSEASGVNVTVRVMTGQRLSLKIDDSTRVQDLLTLTVRFLGFQKVDESFFCLTKLIDNEYFYVSPCWKLMKLRDIQILDVETENPRKSKSRRRSSSLHARYTSLNTDSMEPKNKDMGTFYLRFFETPESLSQCSKRLVHLMYLQIRQDYLHGYYRMPVEDHVALSGLTLKLDSMVGHPDNPHRYLVEKFNPQDYLPSMVVKCIGEKQAKDRLIKMAQKVEPSESSGLEVVFINRLLNAGGLVNFVYTEDDKGMEMRLENSNLLLAQILPDRFQAGLPETSINWQDVKDLKKQGGEICFTDNITAIKYRLQFGARCRRILDALQQNVKIHSNKTESPRADRGKRFREFCQKLKSHVTEGTTTAGRREIKKKRRSLPSLGSEFRSSLIETRTRCSIRRLKHYSSMANNLIVKSTTDLSGKSSSLSSKTSKSLSKTSLTSSKTSQTSKTSLTSSKASPSDDERMKMKKFKLDKGLADKYADKPEYRYRVYLENDDYDDMSSSMESSAIVDYAVLDKKTVSKGEGEQDRLTRTGSAEDLLNQQQLPANNTSTQKKATNIFASHEKMFRSCDDITGLFSTNNTRIAAYHQSSKPSSRNRPGRSGVKTRRSHKIVKVLEQEHGSPIVGEGLDSSLSVSLLERFDNMDTAEWEPTRRVVTVKLRRNESTGKLGVRITETPSGIYVEGLEDTSEICSQDGLKVGDKILEIDGINIEGLGYARVLEIIQRSGDLVQLIVSQLVQN